MEPNRLFVEAAAALGAELVSCTRLEGGSSANVWRLDLRDGTTDRTVVFRQHEAGELKAHAANVARKEYELLVCLSGLGFPVAAPLYHDAAHNFLVTEFVDGGSTVVPALVPHAIEEMADLLARLHALDPDQVTDDGLAPLEDPLDRLRTCLPLGHEAERLKLLLSSGQIAVHLNSPVLVHGDYWPGNVLWLGETLAALIDWEDACLGDPLADLACARVELLCQYDQSTMADFTNRYLQQSANLDIRSLPLWECYVSATALQSMHLWGLTPAEESRRRGLTQSFFDQAATSLRIGLDSPD